MNMTLNEIADVLRVSLNEIKHDNIRGVSIDTRTIEPGMVFFALQGNHFDGHNFVEEAFQKGACAAVIQEKIISDLSNERLLFPVENTLMSLQKVAQSYRNKFNIPVIGITGSNGKTTTKEMIGAVLETKFRLAKTTGNLNNLIGVPLTIFSWKPEIDLAVIEMGTNHFGEINQLCEIAHPTQGIITNIGKSHLEFFKNLNGVTKAKGELLQYLGKKGLAFINGDDPYLLSIKNQVGHSILYGFSEECDVRGEDANLDAFGFPEMKIQGKKVKLSTMGKHNLYNGLAAFAVGEYFGVPYSDIIKTLETWQPYEKRMCMLQVLDILILDDTYNANPTSVEQAVLTLCSINTVERRIAVIGDMLELGSSSRKEHENIGLILGKLGVDVFYGFGKKIQISVQVAQKMGLRKAIYFSDKQELIKDLISEIQKGDGILVKGSRGMRMEEIIAGIKIKLVKNIEEN